jgi:citrate synthase
MPDRSAWITTTEAAQRLGVKRATLYAYVSRGLLRSERRPGQQESLFDRAQVDALASSARATTTGHSVLRFRTVATTVSSQADGVLRYRGVPLDEVVDVDSVERAGALVLGSVPPHDLVTSNGRPAPAPAPTLLPGLAAVVDALPRLPLERRVPVAVQLLAASDPFAGDTDPERVRAAAAALVPAAVSLAAPSKGRGGRGRSGGPAPRGPRGLDRLVLAAVGGDPDDSAAADLVRVLLVSLLDHGLTASTVAARVAASTRAGLHDCLQAAYAAMAGPLHGAAPVAAHRLLAVRGDPATAVAQALRDHGSVPGFGHFLYPEGDPRAALVLECVWRLEGTADLRRRVREVARLVAERTGAPPNIDLASAAALHALGLPAAAGEVVFQVARSFGVAAHVVEEYAEEPLRWRGRDPAA